MKEYKTKGVVTLHGGNVQLSEEQADARSYALVCKDKKKGIFAIESPIQFKAGEVFGYDGKIPKSLIDKLGSPDDDDVEQPVVESQNTVIDRAYLDANYPDMVAEIKAEGAEAELREQEIMQAIDALDASNPEHYTEAGLPQVKAIESLLGYNIDADERDAAFKRLQTSVGMTE